MAGVNGISVYQPSAVTIQSVGTTPSTGWSKVSTMKGSDLPSGTGDYGFVVWGNVANVLTVKTSSSALMEVGLGDQSGPFPSHIQSLGFKGGSTFFRRQGVGFHLVLVYETGSRGTWNSSNDLVLWARIYENKSTPGVAGGFVVSDIVMHAFDLAQLTTTITGNIVSSAIAYGGAPTSGNQWKYTSLAAFASALWKENTTWLVFWHSRYAPDPNARGSSVVALRHRPDRTVNWDPNSTPAPPGDDTIFGADGRTGIGLLKSAAVPGQSFCTWAGGGMIQFSTSLADADPDLQFYGLSADSLATGARFYGGEFLAVDVADLEDYAHQLLGPHPGGSFDKLIHNAGGVKLIDLDVEGHETTRGFFADMHAVWTLDQKTAPIHAVPSSVALANPYHLGAEIDIGKALLIDYAAQYRTEEHYQTLTGFGIGTMPPAAITSRMFAWGTGTGTTKAILSRFLRSVIWNWANAPDFASDVAPAVGAQVEIHPGYESFAMANLTFVPIEPQDTYNERNFDPKERLETDLGYELTWPRTATPRNRMTLRWGGLTIVERDSLATFFAAKDTRAFKWNRPGYGLIALVVLNAFVSSEQGGGLHTGQVDVAEMLYLGGAP